MAGKSYIKVGAYDWDRIKKMYVKTGGQTWTAIRKAYVKTSSGWRKVFDTTSNRPFISGNDIPKIRLNTFRTDSPYNPTGTIDDPVNPVVEAPPVQQMGPNYTSPVLGWPYESLGRHLWGYDGTWVSGNGSSMTFTYTWLYNLSGNQNDNTAELNVTSTTGRTDMLTNLSSHLGQSDGDYFDRNFLTFRVSATNSAGTASAESTQVYIVRERPTGTITMLEKDIALTATTMSANFTFSSRWYDKTDLSESYVEWFAVDNLTDALTTSNRVQIEYLSTFPTTGTTVKSATTYHNPTIINKYYIARLTLNNSGTLPAKYLGSVININGFTPKSAFTVQDNKNIKTNQAQDPEPFNTISFIKGFPSSSSQGVIRSTSLSWNASTNATRYQILYEGSNDNVSWTTEQTYLASPYSTTTSNSASWGSPKPSGGYNYYSFMRASIRASNPNSSVFAFSDGGSSSSPVYIYATGTAPTAPSFGTITAGSTTATIPVSISSSTGSNYLYSTLEYMVRRSTESYGSTWSTTTISGSSATISLTNLIPSSTYYVKVRVRNYDDLYGQNETNFPTGVALTPATSTSIVSMSRLNDTTVRAYIGSSGASGPYYQLWWVSSSTAPVGENRYDAASTTSTIMEDYGFSSGTTYYFYVRSSSENLGNTINNGVGTAGTYSEYGPSTGAASYTFASPTGSVSVSPSSGTGGTTTYTASPSISAAPAADISYQWQYFEGGSFGWVALSGATSSTYSPPSNYASIYGTGLRCQIVANNGVGTLTTQSSSVTVNASGVAPSGGSVTLSPSGTQQAGTTITANVSAMSGTATISYQTYIVKKTGSSPTSDTDGTRVASGTGTGNVASHTITASEASGTPDQFRAFTTGTNGFGSNTVASNTVISTPAVVTQYTISWNANGGSVSPASNTVNSGTSVTAPTPTRAGYTFLYWRDSPNVFSYVYQINPGGSWTVTSNITFYAYWQASATAPSTPTGVTVSGSGLVSWDAVSGADTYEVLNYTDRTSAPTNTTNRLGPYTTTGITGTSLQLSSTQGYAGSNNYARAQVRARNTAGVSTYSAWYPSSTTYV